MSFAHFTLKTAPRLRVRYDAGNYRTSRQSKDYRGRLGLKDLQRRLDYWETRVADFAAMAAEAEGDAKKSAAKLLKSGEKLLKTIRGEVAQRSAA